MNVGTDYSNNRVSVLQLSPEGPFGNYSLCNNVYLFSKRQSDCYISSVCVHEYVNVSCLVSSIEEMNLFQHFVFTE